MFFFIVKEKMVVYVGTHLGRGNARNPKQYMHSPTPSHSKTNQNPKQYTTSPSSSTSSKGKEEDKSNEMYKSKHEKAEGNRLKKKNQSFIDIFQKEKERKERKLMIKQYAKEKAKTEHRLEKEKIKEIKREMDQEK